MQNFFKDDPGNVVLGQRPNAPIIVWATAKILSLLPLSSVVSELFSLIAFGALFTWAWMEIFYGVNLFRRTLGLTVLTILLALNI